MRPYLNFLLISACAVALTGCDSVRDTFGLTHSAPDEFAVATSAPLVLPPDYTLRPPVPGAERPQEVTAGQQAQQALLGATDAGSNIAPTVQASSGETALLQQAGTALPAANAANARTKQAVAATSADDKLEAALFGQPQGAIDDRPVITMDDDSSWF